MFTPTLYADSGWIAASDLDKPSDPQAALAIAVATELLTQMTAGIFPGVHRVTEMYDTRVSMSSQTALYAATLRGVDYRVLNQGCNCDSCGVMHRIRLRGQPVRHIISVVLNGKPLQPTEYVLLDHSVLGFLTGGACCASCVTVRYEYGAPPPSAGRLAALKLANELIESLDPNGNCSLPQRVTSVSRQGVSWTMLDTQDFLQQGRTGVYEVDLFIKTYNPAGALRPARVYSVDRPRASTTVMEYPPLATVIEPNDLVVVPGAVAGWLVNDQHAFDVLTSLDSGGSPLATPMLVVDGVPSNIYPMVLAVPSSTTMINLMIDDAYTKDMRYGAAWRLYGMYASDDSTELLLSGEVRTL